MQQSDQPPGMMRYLTVGVEFALVFLMFLGAGFWVDHKLKTGVGFTLLGAALGFWAALYRLLQETRDIRQKAKRPPDEGGAKRDRDSGRDNPAGGGKGGTE